MTSGQAAFIRRVQGALDATPSRIPVILGGCGTGRTWLLRRLAARMGGAAQYVNVERCASTPERFFEAVTSASPFAWADSTPTPDSARGACEALFAFFGGARVASAGPATFLLDEVLEIRTFESFPGLRHVLQDLLATLAATTSRFVLTTRYVARAHRLFRDATSRFEVMHVPMLTPLDVVDVLAPAFNGYDQISADERDSLGHTIHALTDGRVSYVRAIGTMTAHLGRGADPVSALGALLAPDGPLDEWCRSRYELRLHRARGYGALKAILDILAGEEPLTLTEISQRLRRTPGSTKDYLSWLEDVDLVTSRRKRYSFTDPLLRVWVRLHCHSVPPTEDDVAREVQRYAAGRLPAPASVPALAYAGIEESADEKKNWGIIEID